MAFLYKELPRDRAAALRQHLTQCGTCQGSLREWNAAVADLNRWHEPANVPNERVVKLPAMVKWALAALVLIGIGFSFGRFSTPHVDLQQLQAAVEGSLRTTLVGTVRQEVQAQLLADWKTALSSTPSATPTPFQRELRKEMSEWVGQRLAAAALGQQQVLTEFAAGIQQTRAQDQQTWLTLLAQAEERHDTEHLGLRRALETVALVAADKFQRTESELGQLASLTQANWTSEASEPLKNTVNP